MVLVKTQAGQDALKNRHGSLSSRQRSAFILFDGKRSTGEVLAATAAMGITQDDVDLMIAQGLLGPQSGQPLAVAAVATVEAAATDLGTIASSEEGSGRSPKERYQAAYPVATELTASLGLRGFRLNLAVEGAGSFEDLAALAPKIREAVGDAKFERLDKALFD
ncbi:hypothetical protein [Acidovorax sp.]|uniref:hypothetical protein n=1 Tax=Acidovorax sp. TaxID=1872122 RepID=UPI00260E789B|nr:hypothetical protein [Acidovorax sp.]